MSAVWARTRGQRHHGQRAGAGRSGRHAVDRGRVRLAARQDAAAGDHGAAGVKLRDVGGAALSQGNASPPRAGIQRCRQPKPPDARARRSANRARRRRRVAEGLAAALLRLAAAALISAPRTRPRPCLCPLAGRANRHDHEAQRRAFLHRRIIEDFPIPQLSRTAARHGRRPVQHAEPRRHRKPGTPRR